MAEVAGAVNELADALARSEARQREFLLSVSHELRTPLTAVRGFAESLADGVVTGDDVADAGRMIVREADRLDRLVGDLMELARLEADDFRLDPMPVDLAALAADAAAVWAARCADAGVGSACSRARPGRVRADPRRLRQVVDGLAENALRVTPPGAPLVFAAGGDAGGRGCRSATAAPGSPRGLRGRVRPRSVCTSATAATARSARAASASPWCTAWSRAWAARSAPSPPPRAGPASPCVPCAVLSAPTSRLTRAAAGPSA